MAYDISQSKQEKLEKQNIKYNHIMMIPIILLTMIVPLIVRLSVNDADTAVQATFKTSIFTDFFSQYKSIGIIITAIVMLIILFLLYQKEWVKKDSMMSLYTVSIVVFLITSLVSTMLSDYKQVSWWGLPDRAEGMLVILSYIIILGYSIYTFRNEQNYIYILGALAVVVGVNLFLGIFQYMGNDILVNTSLGNHLIMSKEYQQLMKEQGVGFAELYSGGNMYGTMYHYNYIGSFTAMVIPLFTVLTLLVPGRKKKICLGIVTLCAVALLIGSTARSGIIGVVCACVMGAIIFGRKIARSWKTTVIAGVILGIILIGANIITSGKVFSRIPNLLEDIAGMIKSDEQVLNYKDYIPVRDIIADEGSSKLVLQGHELIIAPYEQGVVMLDENEQIVDFTEENGKYYTTDERFKHISFTLGVLQDETDDVEGQAKGNVTVQIAFDNEPTFLFKVDSVEGVYLVDPFTKEKLELSDPAHIGFTGKEKMGSSRGYIWSRTLPLLKNTWLIGTGPDTFPMIFPQNDLLGKWWAYDTPNTVVDKPHNLYVQIAVNNGGLALVAFLVVIVGYIGDSIKLYGFRVYYGGKEILGAANVLAIVGYLGAGLFNDSVVSVAPIFWVLLGIGIAINYIVKHERIEIEERIQRAHQKVSSVANH